MKNLISAIKRGNYQEIKTLIEQGVDVNERNGGNWTPLMFALHEKKCGMDIIELLIDSGADVNAFALGRTMDESIYSVLYCACLRGQESIKLLLDCGADVDDKCAPFIRVYFYDHPQYLKYLKSKLF